MAKDAKGHGSEKRGGSNGVETLFSSRAGVKDAGKGMYATLNSGAMLKLNPAATGGRMPKLGDALDPSQHTVVREAVGSGEAHVAGIAAQHGIGGGALAPGGRHGYNPDAVNKAIASSNRSGRRIGGKEASAIHRLLKGRG